MAPGTSDNSLGAQFAGPDEEAARAALGELVRRHAGTFRAMAARFVEAKHVDDLLQDHALRLFANRMRFDPEQAWLPWARRVLQNLAIDSLRRQDDEEPLGEEEAPDQRAASPSETAEGHEEERIVRECMEELAAEDRSLLTLKQWEGLTFEEIGERLGMTPNTASSRYYRALSRLAEALRRRGLRE